MGLLPVSVFEIQSPRAGHAIGAGHELHAVTAGALQNLGQSASPGTCRQPARPIRQGREIAISETVRATPQARLAGPSGGN